MRFWSVFVVFVGWVVNVLLFVQTRSFWIALCLIGIDKN